MTVRFISNPKNLTRIARDSFKKRLNGSDVAVPAPILPAPSRGNCGLGKIPNIGEVKKALNDLNNGKAKDPFGICFELLKEGGGAWRISSGVDQESLPRRRD